MSLNLEVQILGEYKNLTKATKGAASQLKGLQSTTRSISRSINATLATIGATLTLGGLVSGIRSVVTEASNLEQGIGAAQAVFKGFSDSVVANARTAANEFGLSATQYLKSANLIGAQLSNLGFNQEEYTNQSQELVALGADLAATFGGTTYDAVLALSAVFRGEYNQVERYGVAIRKSDINARVAERGQAGLTGELLKQAEATAALEILYTQTSAAQGQFQRETDTFAGSMQILRANVDNAKISIGEGLAPALVTISSWITDNIGVINDLTDAIGTRLKTAFEGTGDSAESFGAAIINTITDLTAFLNGSQDTSNVFVQASENIRPILEILGAFGELAKGLITVLNGVFDGLFGWLKLIPGVNTGLSGFALFVDTVGKVLQQVGYWIGFLGTLLIPFTAGFKLAAGAVGALSKTAQRAGEFVAKLASPITNFFGRIGTNITNVVTKARGQIDDLAKAGEAVSKAAPSIFNGFRTSAPQIINASKELIKQEGIVGGLTKTFANIPNILKGINIGAGVIRTSLSGVAESSKQSAQKAKTEFDKYTKSLDAQDNRRITNFVDVIVGVKSEENRRFSGPGIDPVTGASLVGTEAFKAAQQAIIDAAKNLQSGTGLTEFQKNVQKLIDGLTSTLDAAKKRIKDASENFRDAVSVSFGVITNGAFAVFDINRVLRQMRRLVDGAKNFAKDIKKLQQQGADQSLIEELLGMDPLQGAAAARGLLSSGRLSEFLGLRTELAGIGAGAGGVANFGINGTGTTGLQNAIDSLTKTLNRGYGNTYNINVNNANKMSGKEIVAEIKRYEKTTGRAVL